MSTDEKGAKENETNEASGVDNQHEVVNIEENKNQNQNQNQNENKLSNIPDLLQEVKEVIVDRIMKREELKNSQTLEASPFDIEREQRSYKNRQIIPILRSIPKSKSGGLLVTKPLLMGAPLMKHKSIPTTKRHYSHDTITTLEDSGQEPISTQSSIQNSERESLSTESSNQTSNGTSTQNSEPGIISNQLSLSYDVSELEPVSLYSFHLPHNLDTRNHFEVEMKQTPADHAISMCSIGSVVCRICHNAEEPERLISPCLCKGTLAYVHKNCLEHWLRTSGMVSCELCHYRFKVRASLRYTLLQSLRMWYSHPNNRGLLQADFLVCSLLTVVSFGLVGISMMALQHFVLQGRRYGVSRFWTQICILMFLSVISFVYSINMFLILKSQLVPWYTWWQSAKDVTLILENRKSDSALIRLKEKQKQSEEIELESMIISREARPLQVPTPPHSVPHAAASHSSKATDCVTTV